MSRLPTVGSDNDTWGNILNDYLAVEHNADGSQKALSPSKITPGNNGDVLTTSSGAVAWAAPGGGGSPSGPAGGSLAGTYPNPTLAAGAVGSTEIADDSIVDADINASAAIAKSKLAALNIGDSDITAGGLTNAAISTSAAIAKSKLASLSIVDADVSAISESKVTNLTTDLAAKATDSAVVHNTGAETIAGVKTFSSSPVVPDGSFTEAKVTNLTTDLAAKVDESTVTTKGDLLAATGSAAISRVGVGSDGTVLTADSSQSTGVKWGATGALQSGTSFPGSPSDGDWFYRTDNNVLYFYKLSIARWLSVDLKHVTFDQPQQFVATTAVGNSFGRIPIFDDVYVEKWVSVALVQTTNNGSNYYAGQLLSDSTVVSSFDTSGDTLNTRTTHTVA